MTEGRHVAVCACGPIPTLFPPVPKHPPANPPRDDASDDATDLRIIDAIRRGDPAGWNTLITRYQDRLFAVCVRMVHNRDLAADLTQDAFVKLIQGLPSFDGRAKFSTWAIRVTMNVCLSRLRSEKLRRHASLEALSESDDGTRSSSGREAGFEQGREQSTSDGVELHEDRARVLAALRELDPDQRSVIILSDCHGQSYEQIAAVLGVAVGTVKSRLFRARTALRDAVEAMSKSPPERRTSHP
ncbi:MAG: RNA polymerase subunit sigma-24 [Phycisphaerae bacterium]|nr:MAG: RNA polymerase subunit sigma-24 [Phycisphaerae bacterium]